MHNIVQISFIAIKRTKKKKFARFIFIRCRENCANLPHFNFNNPVIDGNANISTSNVTVTFKVSTVRCIVNAFITGYIECYFDKKYHGVYRTFKILFPDYHLPMISQNFVNCKQNFKNLDKKIMKIEY